MSGFEHIERKSKPMKKINGVVILSFSSPEDHSLEIVAALITVVAQNAEDTKDYNVDLVTWYQYEKT